MSSTDEVITEVIENEILPLSEEIIIKKSRYTESQKRASYKYQKKNSKELYQKRKDQGKIQTWIGNKDTSIKDYMTDYYETNKEKYKLRNKEAYQKRKEKALLNIL